MKGKAEYLKSQKTAIEKSRMSFGADASFARLTTFGLNWWATKGDLQNPTTVGEILFWGEKQKHPLWGLEINQPLPKAVKDLRVERKSPRPESGWISAAFFGKKTQEGTLDPRSHIAINLDGGLFPHPNLVLRSLVHEIAHALQCLQGRFTESIPITLENRDTHHLELEAKNLAASIGLMPWPEKYLGPIKDFPYVIEGPIIPSHRNPKSGFIVFERCMAIGFHALYIQEKNEAKRTLLLQSDTKNPVAALAQEMGVWTD